mmetsp:Transcript_14837/g.49722  ORF Transcript_14837/g.49722 Transcript_14837/m.49722 type:complete len:255 (-) Transcript_14837:428-1192(-)
MAALWRHEWPLTLMEEASTLSSSATYSNTSNFEPSPSIRAALNAALHPHVFTACATALQPHLFTECASAPQSSTSHLQTSSRPCHAASMNAVSPSFVLSSTPRLHFWTTYAHTFKWPLRAAQCSAVRPFLLRAWPSTFNSPTSHLTISRCPPPLAQRRAEDPCRSVSRPILTLPESFLSASRSPSRARHNASGGAVEPEPSRQDDLDPMLQGTAAPSPALSPAASPSSSPLPSRFASSASRSRRASRQAEEAEV